ncbi:hypothetical protein SPRG_19186 [Saprolegnia parasitica CBS 223.65]|uniref:Uncharacterized protein n=1 Tax=Saprolegnia parasitica (strain CBS 223.65) TaxID=695850 RepID=A0A067D3F1_SAPPC|nr:hypothetical protein SPRG_19186 [Saprolegnia parasitica CBS 223.65]KDO33552.1 hypothetical protein SPRG_19186 [Saprolegnia parasitica CBS 223.65]|eukprot:XP_012195612.1 hypothetical protein SPRG_19186 [Saprolegnia parasitica CBS 223.65]
MYSREVQVFLAVCSNGALSLQLFALSTRLLWVNCGFLKLFKLLWSILSTATYSGESKLMGYLNFTGVTSLYLSAILLFYIPPFIEYNNHIRQDIRNAFERLDGTPVSYYESFYIRSSGAIVGGLLLNVLLAVGLDQLVNRSFWKLLATNSLARQAMYNSTSILMDYIIDIDPKLLEQRSKSNAVIFCKARRLCTLQWFLMSHLTTFGLPEKELRVKKLQPQGGASKNATQASGLLTQAETASEKSEKPTADRYLVVQDSGRHVHLLDADLRDVKNLVINIKILKNTAVSIY